MGKGAAAVRGFLSVWSTDLGGKKNFHNGVGGTYD